ncbi:serine hydrolase domain-containing protein [Corynebacterium ciconiae]|uniref:serine hydrolase domain-containing protein n=1 Tax=Corynebacterium ciconiae TaxID=227319 RepID=UPI0003AA48D2|nr:serine hydrolase domain-containing protein [Corynebacterium ciconiae]
MAAIAVGLAVAISAFFLGPQRISLSTQSTGDGHLAAVLGAHADAGQHDLSAFVVSGDTTTFAGVGADENTELEIGSISKMFTAELLSHRLAEDCLTPQTTVGDIHPTGGAIDDATLIELAEHTSGLPRLGGTSPLRSLGLAFLGTDPYRGVSPAEVFKAAGRARLEDRGQVRYSNLGYALLGQLLAEQAGKPWQELVSEEILEPLGMSSTYAPVSTLPPTAPHGFTASGLTAQPWIMEGYAPAGGLRSTSTDMAKFAQLIASHATSAAVSFASQDSPLSSDRSSDSPRAPLGWMQDADGLWWHNGGTGGYSTILIIDPRTGDSAFVAGNTATGVDDLGAVLLREGR